MKNIENKNLKKLNNFVKNTIPLNDNVFMIFAQNKKFCEEFLRVVLQDKKIKVIENEIQKHLPSAFNKYVTIDMLCRLGDDRLVNVEIQLAKEKGHAKRIFEYISKIKNYLTEKGETYKNIKDVIVIYLTKDDIFKKGSTVYEVSMNIVSDKKEVVSEWDSGFKVYYVNTKGLTNKTINTYLKILTDRTTVINKYKVTSEIKKGIYKIGGVTMSKEMMAILKDERLEGVKEGRIEGIEIGIEKGRITILLDMVKNNLLSTKDAAKVLGVSERKFLTYLK